MFIIMCKTFLRNSILDFHHDFCTLLYNRNGIRQINQHSLLQLSTDFQDMHLPISELKINSRQYSLYVVFIINSKIKPIPDLFLKIYRKLAIYWAHLTMNLEADIRHCSKQRHNSGSQTQGIQVRPSILRQNSRRLFYQNFEYFHMHLDRRID